MFLDESTRKLSALTFFPSRNTVFFEAYRTPKTEIGRGRTSRPKSSCVPRAHTHARARLIYYPAPSASSHPSCIHIHAASHPQAASSLVARIYLPFQAFYFQPYLFTGTFTLKVFRYLYTSLYLENRPSFLSLSLSFGLFLSTSMAKG